MQQQRELSRPKQARKIRRRRKMKRMRRKRKMKKIKNKFVLAFFLVYKAFDPLYTTPFREKNVKLCKNNNSL